jgi:hypothetical protein
MFAMGGSYQAATKGVLPLEDHVAPAPQVFRQRTFLVLGVFPGAEHEALIEIRPELTSTGRHHCSPPTGRRVVMVLQPLIYGYAGATYI